MSKHTPGPFTHEVWPDDFRGTGAIWADPNEHGELKERVAQVQFLGSDRIAEFEANCRLFAAAPELLEALKELVNSTNAKQNAMWNRARAAIAKAEGGE